MPRSAQGLTYRGDASEQRETSALLLNRHVTPNEPSTTHRRPRAAVRPSDANLALGSRRLTLCLYGGSSPEDLTHLQTVFARKPPIRRSRTSERKATHRAIGESWFRGAGR